MLQNSKKNVQLAQKGLFCDCEIELPFIAVIIFNFFIEFDIDFQVQKLFFELFLRMIDNSHYNAA